MLLHSMLYNSIGKWIVIILFLTAFYSFNELSCSSPSILYVGGHGEGNYSTIQSAINDASPGDIIFVFDDSSPYHENIIINKSIKLIGENKETTIIEGERGSTVTILSNWVYIENFTIRNNDETGITIHSSNNVIINNDIINCFIGLNFINSNHNLVTENLIKYNGVGMYFNSSCNNTLSFNIICQNGDWGGIYLFHSSYNNFTNNNIASNSEGMMLYSSNGNILYRNEIKNNRNSGIELIKSSKNKIYCNNVSFNGWGGILVDKSNENSINRNAIISNGWDGISIYSNSSNIFNNYIKSNKGNGISIRGNRNVVIGNKFEANNCSGLYLGCCKHNIIQNNTFINDGLFIYNSVKNKILNNIVNKLPLIYLENLTNVEIEGGGQVVVVGCKNITIKNCTINNVEVGVELCVSRDCKILYNDISECRKGVYLWFSYSNIIFHNFISNCKVGLYLDDSDKNIIEENVILSNALGIYIFSCSNLIKYNDFLRNVRHAFFSLRDIDLGRVQNIWIRNYWGRPYLFPKFIFGYCPLMSLPLVNVDWRPLLKPCITLYILYTHTSQACVKKL